MGNLYTLTFYDDLDGYTEWFFIGVFASYCDAESVAKRYLCDVSGFKDYPCRYEIKEKDVVGVSDAYENVSMIQGWNANDDMDETDIWESDLYADINEAEAAFAIVRKELVRQEWCINTYKIGECLWQEGFVRI